MKAESMAVCLLALLILLGALKSFKEDQEREELWEVFRETNDCRFTSGTKTVCGNGIIYEKR